MILHYIHKAGSYAPLSQASGKDRLTANTHRPAGPMGKGTQDKPAGVARITAEHLCRGVY